MSHRQMIPTALALALGLALGVAGAPVPVGAQDDEGDKGLDGLLGDVGREYAEGFLAPLVQSIGPNQNSGLYSTAHIGRGKVTISFGLKAMGTHLAPEDTVFSRVFGVTLDERYGVHPGDPGYGEQGVVEVAGPTLFGSSREGTVRAYYLGALVHEEPGIEGQLDMRWAPLAMPEVSLGGIGGLRATIRWLPSINTGDDVGKIKLFGWGLQYCLTSAMPAPPVDVMIGYFKQSFDIGDVIETDATSWHLAASKQLGVLTVYGGAAKETSDFAAHYTWEPADSDPIPIEFSSEGKQKSRYTLGAALGLGVTLSAEVSKGSDLTTYCAGLSFGM